MTPVGEQGSGALAVLPILLVIGLSVLLGWQRFLDAATALMHDEQRYLEAFHRAESALSWGMTIPWRGEDGECRHPEGEAFRACLRAPRPGGGWVLRAQSGTQHESHGSGPQHEGLSLYRRVTLSRAMGEGESTAMGRRNCMLIPIDNGWLDFNPG